MKVPRERLIPEYTLRDNKHSYEPGTPWAEKDFEVHIPQSGKVRWEIKAEIDHSREVFQAYDTKLQEIVACKRRKLFDKRDPSERSSLEEEGILQAHLHHPRINRVYDYVEHAEYGYLFKEYLDPREWPTVSEVLRATETKSLSQEEMAIIIEQMAEVTEYLQEQGVFNFDLINPANVFYSREKGQIKVDDLGVAFIAKGNYKEGLEVQREEVNLSRNRPELSADDINYRHIRALAGLLAIMVGSGVGFENYEDTIYSFYHPGKLSREFLNKLVKQKFINEQQYHKFIDIFSKVQDNEAGYTSPQEFAKDVRVLFTQEKQKSTESNVEQRKAEIQEVDVFADPEFFPVPPLPLAGIQYTLVNPEYAQFAGVDTTSGRPRETLLDSRAGEPAWAQSPEFDALVTATNEALQDPATRELGEKVREQLDRLGVYGHAITSHSGSGRELVPNLYSVMKFGLWPEYNPSGKKNTEMPWLGTFTKLPDGSLHGSSAGEFFNSFAVIPKYKSENFVAIPAEYGGGAFVPALESFIVVPNTKVREELLNMYIRADHFSNHSQEVIRQLRENIVTYEEILQDKEFNLSS